MTLRVISHKRKVTFKAPINVVCFILAKAANSAEGNRGVKMSRGQIGVLVKSLRQAKRNFRGLILADIRTKDGKQFVIKL